MYLNENDFNNALKMCTKSLELNPNNYASIINFSDILR